MPFEPPYFEKEGLPTTFIGHSAVEERHDGDAQHFRTQHGLSADKKLLAVLPGSRNSEVKRLLPVFKDVIDDIAAKYPDARIVVPTVSKVADTVTSEMKSWPLDPIVVTSDQDRHDAFSAANCALAASGTVSLELAIAGVPHVIAYQLNAVTGWIAKRLIKVDTVTIVNLVLGNKLIPEFLQENCKAKNITQHLEALMADGPERAAQIEGFDKACTLLGFGDRPPSEKAADQILKIIAKK